MIKALFALILSISSIGVFGANLKFAWQTVESSFIQTTTDERGVVLATALGVVSIDRQGQKINWHTQSPHEEIFIYLPGRSIFIDVALEQVLLREIDTETQNPIRLLFDNNLGVKLTLDKRVGTISWYKTTEPLPPFEHLKFAFFNNGVPAALSFIHKALGQKIEVRFDTTHLNISFAEERFTPQWPDYYDVIVE